jgi:hypothetical protein
MAAQESGLETSPQIRLGGCLTDDTKKQRRTLLIVCALCVGLMDLQLLPKKIEILGVALSEPDKELLRVYLVWIVLFLLVSFGVSVMADYLGWGVRKRLAEQRQHEDNVGTPSDKHRTFDMRHRARWKDNTTAKLMNWISDTRIIIDVATPVLFAMYAILRLLEWDIPSLLIVTAIAFLFMASAICCVVRSSEKIFDPIDRSRT